MRLFALLFLLAASALCLGQIEQASQKPFVPNNRWALVVGVSNYSDQIGALKYTAKEARELSEVLTGELQFDRENVKLLADGGEASEAPTSANILGALDSLLLDKRLDKANLFVFYFSGHGVGTANGDFLLPADTTKDKIEQMGVPVRDVIGRIVKAGLKNVLFIADACRAGEKNDFGADLTNLCHQANIAVILGCSPGKRSYEYPALKQGAFTHFLLEGLKNRELRDASGALWASKLGVDVQTRVHDYTEPDHGKFAQVPALWGEQTTLDVLLAAYPTPPVSDSAIATFKKSAQKLDKADYAVAMINYASALYEKDRYDETVDILKTVDQLGEMTPESRLIMAVALDTLGRTGEAERTYRAFIDMPSGYWRDLGVATSSSRDLDPAVRLKAAMDLFGETTSWQIRMVAFGVINSWGSYQQKLEYAKRLAASPTEFERQKLYGAGQVANIEGRWRDALSAFQKARKAPGDFPTDHIFYLVQLEPSLASGQKDLIASYLAEGKGIDRNAGFAHLELAQLAKNSGDLSGRLTNLRAALATDLSPNLVFLAAKIAGPYLGSMTDEFRAAAIKHPYSWRARIVLYFIKKIKGEVNIEEDALAADRYMDDPLTFNAKLFDFMESFMAEAVGLGTLTPETYRAQLDFYFLTLRDFNERFGYDADLWMNFIKFGLFNERTAQVGQVAANRLKFEPAKAPKDLKPVLLLIATNRGDSATARKLVSNTFEPTEKGDPQWFYAFYQLTIGETEQAAKSIASLPAPSPELLPRVAALKTYFLALGGKAAEAKARLAKPSEDIIARALEGLTWAALGDWKHAEPLLLAQSVQRDWTFLFLQEYALRKLDARYRATQRLALAQDLAYAASISQPGNPLFDEFRFVAQPGVAQFAGNTTLLCSTIDDKNPNVQGTLSMAVDAKGVFTASFGEFKLLGAVDGSGNLHGGAAMGGKKYALMGKIAPAAMYKTYPKFKDVGQVLQLVDEEGFRVILLGKVGRAK